MTDSRPLLPNDHAPARDTATVERQPIPKTTKPKQEKKECKDACRNFPCCCVKDGRDRGIWEKTFWLLIALLSAQYIACSLNCLHPYEWIPAMFSCKTDVPASWLGHNAKDNPICTTELVPGYTCTPMQEEIMMDVFVTNLVLVIYWLVGNFLIKMWDKKMGNELTLGRMWQLHLNEVDTANKRVPPTTPLEPKNDKGAMGNNYQLREEFPHSEAWNAELEEWQALKKKAGTLGKEGQNVRTCALRFFFWLISILNMYLVLIISPTAATNEVQDWLTYIPQMLYNTVVPQFDGAYSFLVVFQFLIELVIFLAACVTVSWQQAASYTEVVPESESESDDDDDDGPKKKKNGCCTRKKITRSIPKFTRQALKSMGGPQMLGQDSGQKIQNTCLLIACHKSTLTKDRVFSFRNTLRGALKVFPANAIFVCDNSPQLNPWDRTEQVCAQISEENIQNLERERRSGADAADEGVINYVYIPEGNKSHAMYWTTEYWIPELVRRGDCIDFKYAIMIDDDVPLPPDLYVPINKLEHNKMIKAICFAICAETESGEPNALVALQDAEYKFAGLIKQFQWKFGTTLCCHGAIALWRRDILGRKILWDHDTEFHGEDMYMGLLLHRLRKDYAIMVQAAAVVPTYAPEDLLTLFRQRVTSWDLCAQRKFTTQLRELFSGCCNMRTTILKPFMVQELVSVLLDYIRLYLLIGLGTRNIVGLFVCFVFFFLVLYIEVILFNVFVLRKRPDLKLEPITIFLFPFYRTLLMFFRIFALMRNAIEYSIRKKKNSISFRHDHTHDLPPCPPVANPNWYTIWHKNHPNSKSSQSLDFTKKLIRILADRGKWSAVKANRVRAIIEATLLFEKVLAENKMMGFPKCLDRNRRSSHRSNAVSDSDLVTNGMTLLDNQLRKQLGIIIGSQWRHFERRLNKISDDFNSTNVTLVKVNNNSARTTLEANLQVTKSIAELIFSTRYPKMHDKATEVKLAVTSLIQIYDVLLKNIRQKAQRRAEKRKQRDSRVDSIPMQLEQILKSGKDPENSLKTIEDFEKEILQLGLKPDVEKKFLKKCSKFKKKMVQKIRRRTGSRTGYASSSAAAAASAVHTPDTPGLEQDVLSSDMDPEGHPE